MYRAFYGLREKPFNLTPDPRFLYLSDKHKEAFAHLLYGIRSRSGFVMVTGEIGTGKTTICRNLLNQLDEDTELAFIFNPMLSPLELLKKIASEFGVDTKGANTLELTEELNQYLLEAAAMGKNCVLLIDEAQNLDPQVLEQIRLLSNLETETEKLLQIVLIGQPELAEKLALHELRQLNQRITARYHLKPLSEKEVMQYVAYRLHVAGGRRKVKFARSAVRAVYKISGGTPRVINALCDRALLVGFTKEVHTISASIVQRAYREIRGDDIFSQRGARNSLGRLLWNPITAITVALIIAIVFANSTVLRQRTQGYLNWLAAKLPEAAPVPVTPPAPPATTETPATTLLVPPPAEQLASATPKPVTAAPTTIQGPPAPPAAPTEALPEALFSATDAASHEGALRSLLETWNKTAAGPVPTALDPDTLAQFARDHDLAVEFLRPAVDQLLALDLPAIVHLKKGDTVRTALLRGVEGDTLTLATQDTTWTMDRGRFRAAYTGDAIVMWEDPAPAASALLPGSRNASVRKLRSQLAALGRIPAPDNGDTYDGVVSKAIARLQAETSLEVDGIAGKQVRMVLQSWSNSPGTPSLGSPIPRIPSEAVVAEGPPVATPDVPVAPPTETSPAPVVPASDSGDGAAVNTPPAPAADQDTPKLAARASTTDPSDTPETPVEASQPDSEDAPPATEASNVTPVASEVPSQSARDTAEAAPETQTNTETPVASAEESPAPSEDRPEPVTLTNVGTPAADAAGSAEEEAAVSDAPPAAPETPEENPAPEAPAVPNQGAEETDTPQAESLPASTGPQLTVVELADPGTSPVEVPTDTPTEAPNDGAAEGPESAPAVD